MTIREIVGELMGYQRMTFRSVVGQTTSWHIEEISNPLNMNDSRIIYEIEMAMQAYMKEQEEKKGRYEANRANDIGIRIKADILRALQKRQWLNAFKLKGGGYPDFVMRDRKTNGLVYLTVKTSSISKRSKQRYLYYTTGKKIIGSGKHLVLDLKIKEEMPKYWLIESWKIKDLYEARMDIKVEFSCSKNELEDLRTLRQS